MKMWMYTPLIMAVFAAVMYLAYRRGLVVSKSIRAVLFFFQPGKNRDRAAVNACTGWVRHGARFRESRRYEFLLDAQLTGGAVEVRLLNERRVPLLRLDRGSPAAGVHLDGTGRYSLEWKFDGATGRCELRWQAATEGPHTAPGPPGPSR